MTILECRNLYKRYVRNDVSAEALIDVSMQLAKGEVLGIAGMSGSGKSTLLKMISGLEKPDKGELYLEGRPLLVPRSREQYRKIQMIFQDPASSFNPRRKISVSIREAVRKLNGKEAACDLAALAESVGLNPALADRYPGELSGGQCQRFAIARALASNPDILLCDEITSALDVTTQDLILDLMTDIRAKNSLSVIMVSHDLAVLSRMCSRIIVMTEGRIVEEGPAEAVLFNPQEEYTKTLVESVLALDPDAFTPKKALSGMPHE
ncbi:MAG: ABC transporter ATP-binding protein [Eubacterium sp.]|nr:ABC transporter ATP-binding protein [Eubacterium sp.]